MVELARQIPETAAKTADPATARSRDLASVRRVLEIEAEALAKLAARLPSALPGALDALQAVAGRVIVSGMGKSGHVARKIASTFASTGTPSLYVHPGEASHGDLGMITEADAVIAISNSGETSELADLVAHSRRFGIPLLAITGRPDSALARAADHVLELPAAEEACPLGLAPTTSTTLMLALGDALAVALLERRGFSAEDFHRLHPGGKLGQKLLKVADLMHDGDAVPLIDTGVQMAEALVEMSSKRFGTVGVRSADGKLVGIVTDGDLRRHMSPDLLLQPVDAVMTVNPLTIRPEALGGEALKLMNGRAITSLFVLDDGRPVGILHIHDLLRSGVG